LVGLDGMHLTRITANFLVSCRRACSAPVHTGPTVLFAPHYLT